MHFNVILQHAQINHFPFENISAAETLSNLLYYFKNVGSELFKLDDHMKGFSNAMIESLQSLKDIKDLNIRLNFLLFFSTNENIVLNDFSNHINPISIIDTIAKVWKNLGAFHGLWSQCIRIMHCMIKKQGNEEFSLSNDWTRIFLETIAIQDLNDPNLNSNVLGLVIMFRDREQLNLLSQSHLSQTYSSLMIKYWKINFNDNSNTSQLALLYSSFAMNIFMGINDNLRREMRKLLFPKKKRILNNNSGDETNQLNDKEENKRDYIEKVFSCPNCQVVSVHGEFLYNLFSQSSARLIKAIGFGSSAGILYRFGHLQNVAQKISEAQIMAKNHERILLSMNHEYVDEYMSSDLEEFANLDDNDLQELLGRINKGNENDENEIFNDMTLEEKELEAEKLVKLINKMDRDGIIKLMKKGANYE